MTTQHHNRTNKMQKRMIALSITLALSGAISQAHAEDMSTALIGVDAREHSTYGYIGVTHHFGNSLSADGMISRFTGFYGTYKYSTDTVTGGAVSADYSAFEALAGYQKTSDMLVLRGYIGAEYEGNHLSPDNPFDGNQGNHYGVKFRGEVESNFSSPNYGNLIATYGTARDRYWVRGRAGRDHSGFVIGPEIQASGDRHSQEERLGIFVNFRNLLPSYLSLSAGQAKTEKNSAGYTPYVTMEFSSTF